jgi:cytochrome c-type biogenesis protein CcmH/NrfG
MQLLRVAIEEGILLGVKHGVALAIILAILYFAATDYQQVRFWAAHGEQVYQAMVKRQQNGGKTQ